VSAVDFIQSALKLTENMVSRRTKTFGLMLLCLALLSLMAVISGSHAVMAVKNEETKDSKTIASTQVSLDGRSHVEFDFNEEQGPLIPPPSEQERLDTIVRAFKHLPEEEQKRLGVNLEEKILEGTQGAADLDRIWKERQKEFRQAMDALMKPAEKMAELVQVLQNSTLLGDSAVSAALIDLDSILGDIDNSRDFHTIGGWPTLVGMLAPAYSDEHRAMAALAVGTAVKNSYDFQLWSLEKVYEEGKKVEVDVTSLFKDPNAPEVVRMSLDELKGLLASNKKSAIDLLVEVLWERASSVVLSPRNFCNSTNYGYDDSLLRRSLYAISAASRGNPDVQEALLEMSPPLNSLAYPVHNSSFMWALETLSSPCTVDSIEVPRKVWAFIDDMLDEREYARVTLLNSPDMTADMIDQLQSLELIGDKFCSASWMRTAYAAIDGILTRYSLGELEGLFEDFSAVEEDVPRSWEASTMSAGEKAAVRATLESTDSVIQHLHGQCGAKEDPSLFSSSVTSLLKHMRSSTRAQKIHEASFHDMNSTYTYSDSQY
jgi:hypothetical protein